MNLMRKVLGKYRKLSGPAKASLWFVMCSVLQKGVSFLTTPIFTRVLSTEEYGQVSVFQTWYSLIAVFTTLNMDVGCFNNGMLKYSENREDYVTAMQGLTTVITGVVFVIYLLNVEFWNGITGLSTAATHIMFMQLVLLPSLMFWSARQRYEYKYIALVVISLATTVLSPLLSLVLIQFAEDKGMARIVAFGIIDLIRGGGLYLYNLKSSKKFYVKEYWKFALSFSIPLIPHYLSMMVLGQSNKIMIEKICGKTEVAIYSVAYSISLLMNIVTNAINSSLTPWIYQNMEKSNIVVIKRNTWKILLGVAGISIMPALLAPEVMVIMAPSEYISAICIIPSVATSVYFSFLYSLFATMEFFYEESKFSAVASSITAIVNIALNAILIPVFGFIAAGYTTMISYILLSILHYCYMRKVLQKKGIQTSVFDDKKIVIISFVYILTSLIILLLYNYTLIRYTIIFVMFVLCLVKRKELVSLISKE